MPGLGHLVHMPSHIDAWVGQWKEAIECNIAAVEADDKYVELTGNESQFIIKSCTNISSISVYIKFSIFGC